MTISSIAKANTVCIPLKTIGNLLFIYKPPTINIWIKQTCKIPSVIWRHIKIFVEMFVLGDIWRVDVLQKEDIYVVWNKKTLKIFEWGIRKVFAINHSFHFDLLWSNKYVRCFLISRFSNKVIASIAVSLSYWIIFGGMDQYWMMSDSND